MMRPESTEPPHPALHPPSPAVTAARPFKGDAVTLGIVGGGQLAKMTAQAAAQLGCKVVVLERNPEFPAESVAARALLGDWNNPQSLLELAASVDVVTLENEFVDLDALAVLEERHELWPSVATMRLIQDKFIQKETLFRAGLPIPRMCAVSAADEVATCAAEWGFPLLLKARRNAYDGKGNATVRKESDIDTAWRKLGGDTGNTLYLEEFCPFVEELAVIVTRSRNGETAVYPVVETQQHDHVCRTVIAPAPVAAEITQRAAEIALRAVEAVGAIGSFGVELFLMADSRILVNELAPRVHNSGHYTIEGCSCSQFENHVRAVLGWPLGSTMLRSPAAMVNLLASGEGPGMPSGLEDALRVPGASVHIYGKARASQGRKMGHITALGPTAGHALAIAQRASASIRFD